ncbi:hypothetical protein ACHAQJ_009678 [Trichoderma viride]
MPPSQRRRRPVEDEGDSDEDARPRQRQHIEASETEQDEEMSNDDDVEMNGATSRVDEQLAKKLVRYAISCEYSRTLIRRDGIKERGKDVEWRTPAQRMETRKENDSTNRATNVSTRKAKPLIQKDICASATQSESSLGDGATYEVKRTTKDRVGRFYPVFDITGSIPKRIDPKAIENSKRRARSNIFRILYNARFDDMAERGGAQRTEAAAVSDAPQRRSNAGKRKDRGSNEEDGEARIHRPPVGYEGDQTITWHVGPRAKEEVGLDGVIGLVREVYGHPEDEAFDKKLRSSLGIKNKPLVDGEGEDNNDVGMTNGV